MKLFATVAAHALVALTPASAPAQLLVTPQMVSARHAGTDLFGMTPPTGAGNLDLRFQPTWFANSHDHGHSSPALGNEVFRSSGYDTVFFRQFSVGEINTAHIQGHAEALARVGGSDPLNITATATSSTVLSFM